MMIVECYSADVYCDCEEHPYEAIGRLGGDLAGRAFPAEFTGRSKRETDRERRKAGWIRVAGKDICPICAARIRQERSGK